MIVVMRKLAIILLIICFHKHIKNSLGFDKFNVKQIQDQLYRCIRYFENSRKDPGLISSYHEKTCHNYKYEYYGKRRYILITS
jgi:hypothetical protein